MALPAESWIELLLRRAPELRRAGILSVGVDGNSAVLAPAEPAGVDGNSAVLAPAEPAGDGDEEDDAASDTSDEPSNPWENPASYPSGNVPSLGEVEVGDELPPIPEFDS